MWIKSQDGKKLGDYKFIFVSQSAVKAETTLDVDTLGEYETTYRACEVLHAIHQAITNCTKEDEIYQGKRITSEAVFQMPDR